MKTLCEITSVSPDASLYQELLHCSSCNCLCSLEWVEYPAAVDLCLR